MKNKKQCLYIMLCAITFALCSCGVKPKHVDSPQGVENDTFPRTYPKSGL